MQEIKKKVLDFLKKYQMDYEDIDIDRNVKVFLDDMAKGLAGKVSSLKMIPTYIQIEAEVPKNETVIVMDAGGTNFRVATVYFDKDSKPVIENFKLYPMPGVREEVSRDRFFEIMAGYIKDIIDTSENIGFCFSYPTEILPNKDGKLLRFSKEIKAKDVQGQIIGQNLNRAIGTMALGKNKHVVLLNDTVAALLAGKDFQNRIFDGYIGFILGTGTNCCYVENNSNITKKKDLEPSGSQIINIESGGFGKCQRGRIDILFDESTIDPGVQTFEKMISGAYLGPLCLKVIHVAADEGLFSVAAARMLKTIKQIETEDVNVFMYYPLAPPPFCFAPVPVVTQRVQAKRSSGGNVLASACKCGDEQDAVKLYHLVDRLIERAARLTAINLSSAAIRSGKGKNLCRPICIVAEGTTFYQLKTLKPRVEYYLKAYLENKHNIYHEIISVENSTLIGAAIAGLTN